MSEKPPRTPMRVALYAAGITLVVIILVGAVYAAAFLPADRDPEKFGEACGRPAAILAAVAGGIAYVIASRRRT